MHHECKMGVAQKFSLTLCTQHFSMPPNLQHLPTPMFCGPWSRRQESYLPVPRLYKEHGQIWSIKVLFIIHTNFDHAWTEHNPVTNCSREWKVCRRLSAIWQIPHKSCTPKTSMLLYSCILTAYICTYTQITTFKV